MSVGRGPELIVVMASLMQVGQLHCYDSHLQALPVQSAAGEHQQHGCGQLVDGRCLRTDATRHKKLLSQPSVPDW